jgi:ribonucleoside-diphosphate reductase alpha chain
VNNKPYEVFALKDNGIHVKTTIGKLVKSDGKYHFLSDTVDIDDLVSHYTTGEEEFTTRMISRLLRTGTPIDAIINDANKTRSYVSAFSQGIKRVLSKYMSNDTKQICPNCGNETLVYSEGCLKCTSCGEGKCG